MLGGLYWIYLTTWHAKSEDDVAESYRVERESRNRSMLASGETQFHWAYRATYRHPVLMRLPGVLQLTVGTVLVVVGAL